jgi:hypothetical protein
MALLPIILESDIIKKNSHVGFTRWSLLSAVKILFKLHMSIRQNFVLELQEVQGVSAETFEPNISVICQWIFMKFKMQIF